MVSVMVLVVSVMVFYDVSWCLLAPYSICNVVFKCLLWRLVVPCGVCYGVLWFRMCYMCCLVVCACVSVVVKIECECVCASIVQYSVL